MSNRLDRTEDHSPRDGRGWSFQAFAAPLFVWIVFAAMLACAHVFVARYSSPMPMSDDLEWAPQLDSASATPFEWWWSCFNEHRIPLPRAIFLALVRSTHDIRSGMFFDVYLLGAVAAAMILCARKLRGRTSYSDAFFPLLFLHWGNAENLLMMHQISLIVPSAITCALLCLFAAQPGPPTWKRSLLIGLCTFSLPLCGAPGLTPAPAIVLWLLVAGWRSVRSAEPGARKSGLVLFSSAIATLLLIGLYFYDYDGSAAHGYNKDPFDTLRQALMFLSLGFGPAAREYWTLSGWATAAFSFAALSALLLAFERKPGERLRIAGMLAIGAGIISMAISTGIARGGSYEWAGFAARYVTLPAPLFCCVYLGFCLYGPAEFGRFVRVALCSIMLALVYYNVQAGANYGARRALDAGEFCKDVTAGLDVRQLAVSHWKNFYNNPEEFEVRLECLRRIGFGPLAQARATVEQEALPMFEPQPMLVSSSRAVTRKVNGEQVLLVPPECELHFSINTRQTTAEGRFGIYPLAYPFTHPGGVRFSAELIQVARPVQTLFECVLDPQAIAGDCGWKRFSFALPEGAEGALVLRTAFAGDGKDARAFGYWTGVVVR